MAERRSTTRMTALGMVAILIVLVLVYAGKLFGMY